VPTYRVYYAEREVGDRRLDEPLSTVPPYRVTKPSDYISETEWEEEVDAPNAEGALDSFFREHIRDNSELMWVDDDGESRAVEGVTYDRDKTYIWIENDRLMEYQGLDEATPGMVSCPLCDGTGEVVAEAADEYLAGYEEETVDGEEDSERISWG